MQCISSDKLILKCDSFILTTVGKLSKHKGGVMFKKMIFLIAILSSISVNCQKKIPIEQRVQNLERQVDSLSNIVRINNFILNSVNLEQTKLTATLALGLNRNFTFSAIFYEGKPVINEKYYQRNYYFIGQKLGSDFNTLTDQNPSRQFEIVRNNLRKIKDLIVGEQEDYTNDKGYRILKPRVYISYVDNSGSSDELIVADTYSNSLKVRVKGILQEIGWE